MCFATCYDEFGTIDLVLCLINICYIKFIKGIIVLVKGKESWKRFCSSERIISIERMIRWLHY